MKYIEVNQLVVDEFEVVVCDESSPKGLAEVAGKEMAIIVKNKLSEILLFASVLGLPIVVNLTEEQDEHCEAQCA